VKKSFVLTFVSCLFFFCACAAGPDRVADSWRKALDSGDAAGLESLSAEKADFAAAIKGGFVAKHSEADAASSQKLSGSAYVVSDGYAYRLKYTDNAWKVECSAAGPFNQSTPEMTLLLALHLVKTARFDELKRLIPPGSSVPQDQYSKPGIELWRDFAEAIGNSRDCRPFDISGDEAVISYGDSGQRQVRMHRSNSLWYIVEIN